MRIHQGLVTAAIVSMALGGLLPAAHAQTAPAPFVPAQRTAGSAPELPSPLTAGWIEEAIEVTVDASGVPRAIAPRTGTPGSHLLESAVRDWVFRPATVDRKTVESHVLVIGVFRPPLLLNGPAIGTPPVTLGAGSRQVAAPINSVVPDYPLRTTAFGVVVVEVLVTSAGRVQSTRLVNAVAGLDTVAVDAARQWTFAPAMRSGEAVPSSVYLVFGFQQPVTGPRLEE